MRKKANLRVFLALVMLASSSVPAFPDDWKNSEDDVSMELIGQLGAPVLAHSNSATSAISTA